MPRRGDLTVLLARAKRTLERHAAMLEKIARELDALAVGCEEALDGRKETALDVRRRRRLDAGILADEANAGARLEMARDLDGVVVASINGRRPFRLAPKLADLLALIASAPTKADDGLSGWRAADDVARALGERRGTVVEPADLTRTLFKLREAFRAAGENDGLIQRHVEGHLRFARRW